MSAWITDEKPKEDTPVLVTTEDDFEEVAYWDGKYWWHEGRYHVETWAKAWLPLPDPYDRRNEE